jgi:micrococcal nuclease
MANLVFSFVFFVVYYNLVTIPNYKDQISKLVKTTDSNNVPEYNDYIAEESTKETLQKTANTKTDNMQAEQRAAQNDENETALVTSIVDGDTIKATIDGSSEKIRLLGIDTPETKDPRKPVQCYGKEATEKLTKLLMNKKVRLVKDLSQGSRDKYGRLLRYIYLEDGTNINATMVKEGYAFAYRKYPTDQLEELIELENLAKNSNIGLWSPKSCNGKV